MSLYWTIPLLTTITLVQVSLIPYLTISGARPNLVVLAVICWSLLRGAREGLIWGFIGGMLLDLYSGGPFGMAALALLFVALLASLGEANISRTHPMLPLMMTLVATLLYSVLYRVLAILAGWHVDWFEQMLTVVLPGTVYNGALALIAFPLFYRLHLATGRERIELVK